MSMEESFERQDVRVSVYFPVRWRIAENPEDLVEEINNHRTCDRFTTPPTAFTDLPSDLADLTEFQEMSPHIYRMWMTLERKLDHIIRLLNQKVFDDPGMEEGFCLDISAGGAMIRTAKKVEPGERLLVRMAPPTFPMFIIEVVALVKSAEPDEAREGKWIISVEFEALNHSDREDLITYIFKRQREILRKKSE